MKTRMLAVIAAVTFALSPAVLAASSPTVTINGAPASNARANIWNGTTYVSLRAVSSALDDACKISWENNTAIVKTDSFTLTARPGEKYITINDELIGIPYGVKHIDGYILVPLRSLAEAFGASVFWSPVTKCASVVSNTTGNYNSDDLYWLSRIISAESKGEPLEGKIAVGNVVLNRVKSSEFPNTIYGVIFDQRWGGQFEPVRNGTIYHSPTEESIEAAKLCLDGVNVVGDSLYFLAPALAQNFWTVKNCEYIATIGCHDFYR